MSTVLKHQLLLSVAAATMIQTCGSAAPHGQSAPPIVGLQQGDGVTFVTAPGGNALTILYDNAVIEVRGAPPIPGGKKSHTRRFELIAGVTGQTLRFWVRGHVIAAGKTGIRLVFDTDGKTTDLSANLTEGEFLACFDAPVGALVMKTSWTGEVTQVEGETVSLAIDSIDIGRVVADSPALVGGTCPAVPPSAGKG